MKPSSFLSIAVVGALALFATKPSRTHVDDEIEVTLSRAIESASETESRGEQFIRVGCQLSDNFCVKVLRNLSTVEDTNRGIYSYHVVRIGGEELFRCLAVLAQVNCKAISFGEISNAVAKATDDLIDDARDQACRLLAGWAPYCESELMAD